MSPLAASANSLQGMPDDILIQIALALNSGERCGPSALRSARLPVNLIGSLISYGNRWIGSPITSQSAVRPHPRHPHIHPPHCGSCDSIMADSPTSLSSCSARRSAGSPRIASGAERHAAMCGIELSYHTLSLQ